VVGVPLQTPLGKLGIMSILHSWLSRKLRGGEGRGRAQKRGRIGKEGKRKGKWKGGLEKEKK